MIEFVKEAGMAFVWLFLGYLLGERQEVTHVAFEIPGLTDEI